jgi:hypothetical protein
MKRLVRSPLLFAGAFCLVLFIAGVYPNRPLGEALAFVFALFWTSTFVRRRFAIRLSLLAIFLAACALALFRIPSAGAFVAGFVACLVVLVLSSRRPAPAGDLRLLLVTRHDAERVGGTETYLRSFLRSVESARRGMRVVFAAFDQGIVHREYRRTTFSDRSQVPVEYDRARCGFTRFGIDRRRGGRRRRW